MFLELHRASDESEILLAVSAITSIYIDEEDHCTVVECGSECRKVTETYVVVKLKLKAANRDGGETFV